MGKYYDKEKVRAGNFPTVYAYNAEHPKPQGRLVGIFDRLLFEVCVDLTIPTEWAEFYGQYRAGMFVDMDLYDVPPDADID